MRRHDPIAFGSVLSSGSSLWTFIFSRLWWRKDLLRRRSAEFLQWSRACGCCGSYQCCHLLSAGKRRLSSILGISSGFSLQTGHFGLFRRVHGVASMTDLSGRVSNEDFDSFFRREFPKLSVLAGATAGNRALGEDIAQEALARVAERWSEARLYDKPGAFARRIVLNVALSRRRRIASEARAMLKLGRPPAIEVTDEGDPAIWRAVDRLAPRQRAVVVLHYLEDRPVAEIAEILDVAVSTATSHLHDARANLARTLGEEA